ncbi:hypothetical protein ACDN41_11800 [Priestia aryabhattai]
MEKMKFHWENEKTGKKGSFTVEALTIDECIRMVEEEMVNGAELFDYYSI